MKECCSCDKFQCKIVWNLCRLTRQTFYHLQNAIYKSWRYIHWNGQKHQTPFIFILYEWHITERMWLQSRNVWFSHSILSLLPAHLKRLGFSVTLCNFILSLKSTHPLSSLSFLSFITAISIGFFAVFFCLGN